MPKTEPWEPSCLRDKSRKEISEKDWEGTTRKQFVGRPVENSITNGKRDFWEGVNGPVLSNAAEKFNKTKKSVLNGSQISDFV